jgi:hypothetical protein
MPKHKEARVLSTDEEYQLADEIEAFIEKCADSLSAPITMVEYSSWRIVADLNEATQPLHIFHIERMEPDALGAPRWMPYEVDTDTLLEALFTSGIQDSRHLRLAKLLKLRQEFKNSLARGETQIELDLCISGKAYVQTRTLIDRCTLMIKHLPVIPPKGYEMLADS